MPFPYWRYYVIGLFLLGVSLANGHTCPVHLNDAGEDDPEIIFELSRSTAEVTTYRGKCGGVLIAENFVLSSHSCAVNVSDKVRIGNKNASMAEILNVSRVHIHRSNSVVLLELQSPSKIGSPIKMRDDLQIKSGTRVRTASFNGERMLKSADSMIISDKDCRNRISPKKIRQLQPRQEVCSSRPSICSNKTICAGSPVVHYNSSNLILLAIVNPPFINIPPLCSKFPKTAIFTSISPFVSWIRAKTGLVDETISDQSEDNEKKGRFPKWAAIALGLVCGFFLLCALINLLVTTITDRRDAEEREDASKEAEEISVIGIEENLSDQPQHQVSDNNIKSPPPSPPQILPRSMR